MEEINKSNRLKPKRLEAERLEAERLEAERLEVGRLEAIWLKRMRRGPMDDCSSVQARAGQGLEGNANQGGKRQVVVLSKDAWKEVEREMGQAVDPRLRRGNLFVSGLDLRNSRGRILVVGDCRIEIYGETRPCRQMDDACPGLQKALDPDWRAGIHGVILNDAEIEVGASVYWLDQNA